tara:strand:- start:2804 stop:2959 length:156 start_codon:yes stop_codon:yes gene_type:complete
MRTMEIEEFIEQYILPTEISHTRYLYETGELDYDIEYLIECATELGIRLEK